MKRQSIRGAAQVAALICMMGAAVPALADPDVDAIAKELAKPTAADHAGTTAPAGGCTDRLPDGTLADCPDSRQVLFGKGRAASASRPVSMAKASSFHQDISMTFEKGSAELTPRSRAILDKLAVAIRSQSSYRPFEIDGHTDKSGSREVNQALSQARAQSVVDYLASKGVDASRMKAVGYGYNRPLPNVSADNPANRRVELAAF